LAAERMPAPDAASDGLDLALVLRLIDQ